MKKARLIIVYILISIALAIVAQSCLTQNKIDKVCAKCPTKTIIKDSINTVVTPFDTTLFITRHGEEISLPWVSNYMSLVDSLNYLLTVNNNTITTNKNGITSTITRVNNRITFKCAADSLAYLLRLERERKTIIHTEIKEVPAHCTKEHDLKCNKQHRTGFDTFLRWLFWIVIGLIAVRNLPTILKTVFTGIRNFK